MWIALPLCLHWGNVHSCSANNCEFPQQVEWAAFQCQKLYILKSVARTFMHQMLFVYIHTPPPQIFHWEHDSYLPYLGKNEPEKLLPHRASPLMAVTVCWRLGHRKCSGCSEWLWIECWGEWGFRWGWGSMMSVAGRTFIYLSQSCISVFIFILL